MRPAMPQRRLLSCTVRQLPHNPLSPLPDGLRRCGCRCTVFFAAFPVDCRRFFSCTTPPLSILFHYLRLPGWQSVRTPFPLREAGRGGGSPRARATGGRGARQERNGGEKKRDRRKAPPPGMHQANAGGRNCHGGRRNSRNSPDGGTPPENSETLCNALGSTETSHAVFLYPKHYNLSIIAANRQYRDIVFP